MRDVLTFILAGGRGERLDPLTRDRVKPAVPFGGIYRIIDFTLSNCINSGLRRVYVLTQYKSFSLQKHLLSGWNIVSSQLGEFIDVIPAQQRIGSDWYRGTADAIYQNIYAIRDLDPQLILILAGDHIYKMNYQEMIALHNEKEADVTVGCIPMLKETSINFGVVEVDQDNYVQGFQEKPAAPKTIPSNPSHIFASMGIYLFKSDVLLQELQLDAKADSEHDFGKNVIPQMLKNKRRICVYNFVDEQNRPKYWRDIGTRDAYYQANMDLVSMDSEFNLFDKAWPVRTYHAQYPPIKIVSTQVGPGAVVDSLISGGCVIEGGLLDRAVLSSNVKIKNNAEVRNSVLMEGVIVGEHAQVQNAIIDKEVFIPPYTKIGYDLQLDQKRFVLTASGVVIVAKKASVEQ
ncbi:MAG TPA: glucose-1-phosphate adenylyltransferase [Candidatus Omnitrophica bacterium]|nr:MAG: glucose-1-phosphate adenylyltransferase [Omnitrophica WOR_2 bacterium GWA2_45_18]HBR14762.1 glucose-1-phosphate adenylyltransferase [Candidatus Omnitrophota bacterium]